MYLSDHRLTDQSGKEERLEKPCIEIQNMFMANVTRKVYQNYQNTFERFLWQEKHHGTQHLDWEVLGAV